MAKHKILLYERISVFHCAFIILVHPFKKLVVYASQLVCTVSVMFSLLIAFFTSFFLFLFPQIIQRRKRSEMQTEYDFVWPQSQSLIQPSELPSPSQPHTSSQGPQNPLKTSYSLYVSPCVSLNCWDIWSMSCCRIQPSLFKSKTNMQNKYR